MITAMFVTLGEIADINPRLSESISADTVVSFVGMSDVDAVAGDIVAEKRPYRDLRKGFTPFRNEDILVAKITPCFENGKIAQANIPNTLGFGSTEFHVVRAKRDRVDPRYLLHYLRQEWVRLDGERSMTGSAGQRRVPTHFLSRLTLPLPPLPEQLRIADLLDRVDALRAKRRAAIAQFETLTQSLFLDMFGDPERNPKSWPLRALKNGCDQINDCPHSTPKWSTSGILCLRTSNLLKGEWSWTDTRYVTEEAYHERSRRGYLEFGDIVLSREGTVGIAAIVPSGMRACMGQRLVQIRPSKQSLESSYLLQHLLYVLEPKRIARLMVGSTSHHLNLSELRALLIPVPPIDLQRLFTERVRLVAQQRDRAEASLRELNALFAALQHSAFRGEL